MAPMPWFKCFVRGEDFPGQLADEPGLVGFYTTRFVEAASAGEAESMALAALRADAKLAAPAGYQPTKNARIIFEEITELPAADVPLPQPGFAWFTM